MDFKALALPEVRLVTPKRFGDDRGWFMETFSKARFEAAGIAFSPVQENQSFSRTTGTVRGLHFQRAPFVQAKLVRVLKGRIFDVAVDIRPGSSTFGHWVGAELSAEGGDALFIPGGFAHGFCTLVPDCEIAYLVDNPYAPECDGAVLWNDPAIGVAWPEVAGASLSDKDSKALPLADAPIDGR
jgi:dTDP-4-dehydrorhamnose 3,5-epimerase